MKLFPFLCLSFLYFNDLLAFKVSPMNLEIHAGSKYQGFFMVSNNTNTQESVVVSVATRALDEWGEETTEVCDHFQIYPRQIDIGPGHCRMVRLIWKGDKNIPYEIPYRVVFEQDLTRKPESEEDLQSDPDQSRASISIGVKYVCALYISKHGGGKGDVVVKDFSIEEKENESFLLCKLENRGDKHAYLRKGSMEVVLRLDNGDEDDEVFYVPDDLVEQVEADLNIFAKHTRYLKIPMDGSFPRNIKAVAVVD